MSLCQLSLTGRHGFLAGMLLLIGARAAAQDFPEPGRGPLSFETVGDAPYDSYSFDFAADGTLYMGRFGTVEAIYIFDPTPGGTPTQGIWRHLPGGDVTRGVQAVFAIGPTADTLIAGDDIKVERSTDAGLTWNVVYGSRTCPGGCPYAGPSRSDALAEIPPGRPHAGRLLSGGGILYSDDRGASWTQATRSFPGEVGNALAFALLPSGRLLMGGSWGLAASDDFGESYAVTPIWGDYFYEVYHVAATATPGSVQSGAPGCGLPDPSLCDGAVALGIDVTAEFVRAWWTNDGGRTWAPSVPLPEPYDGVGTGATAGLYDLGTGPNGRGRVLAVLARGLIYRSLDGGVTWEAVGRMPIELGGPDHRAISSRLGPDGHLWVGTLKNGPSQGWVYRSAEPATAAFPVAGETPPAPESLGVRVQPNPSSGAVSVTVALAAPLASLTVAVYDALGREVVRVHDGPLAAGSSPFTLDASVWSAGTYVVRASAGTTSTTTRLTIMR